MQLQIYPITKRKELLSYSWRSIQKKNYCHTVGDLLNNKKKKITVIQLQIYLITKKKKNNCHTVGDLSN